MSLLSPNPLRRRWERLVLLWSPLWMGLVLWVMKSGVLAGWGDAEYMAFACALLLPLWLLPWLFPGPEERGIPFWARHGVRFNFWIGLLSLVQTYAGSDFFFDRLGMEYHFPTRLILHRTPVFLYLLTAVYFSTYYVGMGIALRALGRLTNRSAAARWAGRIVLSCVVAFAETFIMASDVLSPYFLYRDRSFMLTWGTPCYATVFIVTLPLYERLDEQHQPAGGGLGRLAWALCAANLLALALYQLFGMFIAPR